MDMDPSDGEWMNPFVPEQPEGTFQKLEKDVTYYVYIIQDEKQEERDRAAMASRFADQMAKDKLAFDARAEAAESGIAESCSCIYGARGTTKSELDNQRRESSSPHHDNTRTNSQETLA